MRFGLIYSSLIGEIWFDLQDKQLLGIILLPLFVRFGLFLQDMSFLGCPRYRPSERMNWVPVLGLC